MKLKPLAVALCLLALPLAPSLMATAPAVAATDADLGDLSAMRAVVADTLDLLGKDNIAGARARITAFESAWDAAQPELRARSVDKWNTIDAAADTALAAVRAEPPVAASASAAVTALIAVLDNPAGPAAGSASVAITDAGGRPVPCEDLLKQLRATTPAATLDDAGKAKLAALTDKGIERCNADDDKRADGFFAEAIALAGA